VPGATEERLTSLGSSIAEALVSDSGGVFRGNQVLRIHAALGIRKEQIEQRRSWQSYIETTFNIQRRMAD